MEKKTRVITFANFKGGTGKTTNAAVLAYTLASLDYRVLVVDLDPQGNITSLFLKTYEVEFEDQLPYKKTIMGGIKDGDLGSTILPVLDNLDLIPAYRDFARYPEFLEDIIPTKRRSERPLHFTKLLDTVKGDYDFIFIDVPPTISVITDSALVASDFAVIIMQTQERSLVGARIFVEEMIGISENYNNRLDLLGVLAVIRNKNAAVDREIIDRSGEFFGEENMFETIISYMERTKTWDITGITYDRDRHDTKVHSLYGKLTAEFLQRIEAIEDEE